MVMPSRGGAFAGARSVLGAAASSMEQEAATAAVRAPAEASSSALQMTSGEEMPTPWNSRSASGYATPDASFSRTDRYFHESHLPAQLAGRDDLRQRERAAAASLIQRFYRGRAGRRFFNLARKMVEVERERLVKEREGLGAAAAESPFYNDEALAKRAALRKDPQVSRALNEAWSACTRAAGLTESDVLTKEHYMEMSRKLYLASKVEESAADIEALECVQAAHADWQEDSRDGHGLSESDFHNCWFQLADLNTDGLDGSGYAEWVHTTLKMTMERNPLTGEVKGWRTDMQMLVEVQEAAGAPEKAFAKQRDKWMAALNILSVGSSPVWGRGGQGFERNGGARRTSHNASPKTSPATLRPAWKAGGGLGDGLLDSRLRWQKDAQRAESTAPVGFGGHTAARSSRSTPGSRPGSAAAATSESMHTHADTYTDTYMRPGSAPSPPWQRVELDVNHGAAEGAATDDVGVRADAEHPSVGAGALFFSEPVPRDQQQRGMRRPPAVVVTGSSFAALAPMASIGGAVKGSFSRMLQGAPQTYGETPTVESLLRHAGLSRPTSPPARPRSPDWPSSFTSPPTRPLSPARPNSPPNSPAGPRSPDRLRAPPTQPLPPPPPPKGSPFSALHSSGNVVALTLHDDVKRSLPWLSQMTTWHATQQHIDQELIFFGLGPPEPFLRSVTQRLAGTRPGTTGVRQITTRPRPAAGDLPSTVTGVRPASSARSASPSRSWERPTSAIRAASMSPRSIQSRSIQSPRTWARPPSAPPRSLPRSFHSPLPRSAVPAVPTSNDLRIQMDDAGLFPTPPHEGRKVTPSSHRKARSLKL